MISQIQSPQQPSQEPSRPAGFTGFPQPPLCVVGLSRHTAPSTLRSLASLNGERANKVIKLAKEKGFGEIVVLSTCNRTELYFSNGSVEDAIDIFAKSADMTVQELAPCLYVKHCSQAASHLFRVVAGLESAVLGETEIVAQVKEAWNASVDQGASGPLINFLFRKSLEAGKRARTETDLCRNSVSTATLAVREIRSRHEQPQVLLIGAGSIARRVAKELKSNGLEAVMIVNRTQERADALAGELGYGSAGLDDLQLKARMADVIVSAVEVTEPLLGEKELWRIQESRSLKPLLAIDLGVPATISRADVPWVERIDIDELSANSEANAQLRSQAIPAAEAILEQELARFNEALATQAAAPTIRALVQRADGIRFKHVEWARQRLPEASAKELQVIDEMARRMMNALLQAPIEGLKTELSAPQTRDIASRLLGLGEMGRDG